MYGDRQKGPGGTILQENKGGEGEARVYWPFQLFVLSLVTSSCRPLRFSFLSLPLFYVYSLSSKNCMNSVSLGLAHTQLCRLYDSSFTGGGSLIVSCYTGAVHNWTFGTAVCFTGEVSWHCHLHGHRVIGMGRGVRSPLILVTEGLIYFFMGFECCCALPVKEEMGGWRTNPVGRTGK